MAGLFISSADRALSDIDGRPGSDQIKQRDDVTVAHTNAADGSWLSHIDRFRAAMEVDVTTHRIDIPKSIKSGLESREPENPRQDPVTMR